MSLPKRFLAQIFAAAAASLIVSTSILPGSSAIETVDNLDVTKYLGSWYQLYNNAFTADNFQGNATSCITADYGLDGPTGNITFTYSSRSSPTGSLSNRTGYIYAGTNESEPGQLIQKFTEFPVPGDYWIVGLGPATFDPDGLYEWAVVSGQSAIQLFILVRDVQEFEEFFEEEVLSLVDELGFNTSDTEPQLIDQEECTLS